MLTRFLSWLDERLDRVIRRRIMSQRLAAGFAMSSYADAESSGENLVFERALRRAIDPKVAQMIRVHQQDEVRHAKLIDERREALGLPWFAMPPALRMVDRLSEAAGGVLDRPMDRDEDVAAVYALLYVVEERAIQSFERLARTAEDLGDGESLAMWRAIDADEHRHLGYCRAIGRRYAGSDAAFEAEVQRIREIEGPLFAQVSRGFVVHLLGNGMLELPRPWGWLLTSTIRAAEVLRLPAPTLQRPVLT
jgi:ferritin-like metal-binding protein YciE